MIFLILIIFYFAYAKAGGISVSSPYALNYNAHAIATPSFFHHTKPSFFASPYSSIRLAAARLPSPYYRHALPYKIRTTPIILPPTSYHSNDFSASHLFPSTYTIPSAASSIPAPLPLSVNHHYPSFYSSPFPNYKNHHHHHDHHEHHDHDFDDTITVGGYSINPYSSYPFYFR